jgi:hypothetical protein
MFYESFRRLVLPLMVIVVICTVWVAAWSQELQAEADKATWPALPLPNREHRSATSGDPSSKTESLQQVLFENNQVVSVR